MDALASGVAGLRVEEGEGEGPEEEEDGGDEEGEGEEDEVRKGGSQTVVFNRFDHL